MKKIKMSLQRLNIQEDRLLTKSELKYIMGGDPDRQCNNDAECPGNLCCSVWGRCGSTAEHCVCSGENASGACGYLVPGEGNYSMGYSEECAKAKAAVFHGNWCCNSCP